MHSSEPTPVAEGPTLLLQLGRLIVRARSRSRSPPRRDRLLQAKLRAASGEPSTSRQVFDEGRQCRAQLRRSIATQLYVQTTRRYLSEFFTTPDHLLITVL
ncbi:hypothetical protein EVAR_89518_1 [Eumeta japonica]|uniref:Uncharacterized protein n=1 Tax=Eumeta variegata TaxID=151549 RepID=A0A4C1Y4L4_EUMVA|nr:hypothetical protein EVAR_89518_1 [Eumeta japonica]